VRSDIQSEPFKWFVLRELLRVIQILLGAIVICVERTQPVVLKSENPTVESQYANEMLAYNVCFAYVLQNSGRIGHLLGGASPHGGLCFVGRPVLFLFA
jgi:hypothetical protein